MELSSTILIAVPVGIFVALIFIVVMYTWRDRTKNKIIREPRLPAVQPVVQNTTLIYTIPTIRQLEVMFPTLTDVSVISADQLPPPYADVSAPPPSYDQIQIDVRTLDLTKGHPDPEKTSAT